MSNNRNLECQIASKTRSVYRLFEIWTVYPLFTCLLCPLYSVLYNLGHSVSNFFKRNILKHKKTDDIFDRYSNEPKTCLFWIDWKSNVMSKTNCIQTRLSIQFSLSTFEINEKNNVKRSREGARSLENNYNIIEPYGGLDGYYFNYLHKRPRRSSRDCGCWVDYNVLRLLLRVMTFRGKYKRQIENRNERFRRTQCDRRQKFTSISSLLVSWNPTIVDLLEYGSHFSPLRYVRKPCAVIL